MSSVIVMTIAAGLAAAFFIFVRVKKGGIPGLLTKTLASVMFIALAVTCAISSGSIQSWMLFIILGMVFGLVGDIVLDLKVVYPESNDIYLSSGMISFGTGHIMFLVATLLLIPFSLSTFFISLAIALPIACGIMLSGKPLKLNFGKFIVHSSLYAVILVFMTVYAVAITISGTAVPLLIAGMGLFLLSDLVLSTMYFGGKQSDKMLCIVNHVLYYAAQICLACFIFFN